MTVSCSESLRIGNVHVRIFPTEQAASEAAATQAASILASCPDNSRIIVGTGNSQASLVEALIHIPSVDWTKVEAFHMDEYVGMLASHPASFRHWLKTRLADRVPLRGVSYLNGDAPNCEAECQRYAGLLRAAPIDLCFLGFGENGHIAFNDPPTADFKDPLVVKRVVLDSKCRLQQVGEGHFPDLESVPREALTITCPSLVSADCLICCVPERRKAEAVRDALEGPLSPSCPASLIRTHPRAFVFLDSDSASLLTEPKTGSYIDLS